MSIAHAPPTHGRRWHVNPWLVAVGVLGVSVIALATYVVVDSARSSSTQGLASSQVVTMLRDRLAALNSGDAKAISAFSPEGRYSKNATWHPRS